MTLSGVTTVDARYLCGRRTSCILLVCHYTVHDRVICSCTNAGKSQSNRVVRVLEGNVYPNKYSKVHEFISSKVETQQN